MVWAPSLDIVTSTVASDTMAAQLHAVVDWAGVWN
jgi:hypothetical protein